MTTSPTALSLPVAPAAGTAPVPASKPPQGGSDFGDILQDLAGGTEDGALVLIDPDLMLEDEADISLEEEDVTTGEHADQEIPQDDALPHGFVGFSVPVPQKSAVFQGADETRVAPPRADVSQRVIPVLTPQDAGAANPPVIGAETPSTGPRATTLETPLARVETSLAKAADHVAVSTTVAPVQPGKQGDSDASRAADLVKSAGLVREAAVAAPVTPDKPSVPARPDMAQQQVAAAGMLPAAQATVSPRATRETESPRDPLPPRAAPQRDTARAQLPTMAAADVTRQLNEQSVSMAKPELVTEVLPAGVQRVDFAQLQVAPPPVQHAALQANATLEMVRNVGQQLASVIYRAAEGSTELALSPKELGSVRMSLSTQDNALLLVIQAERPETADMMRRHLDTLTQEFRSMGFRDINFDFRDGPGGGAAQHAQADGAEGADGVAQSQDMSSAPTSETPVGRASNGSLDLRL